MAPRGPKVQLPPNHEGPLLVIAAGLPRCATTTLKETFELILGIGPTMHMCRVLTSPSTMELVRSALQEPDTTARRKILRKLFDGYACTADFPGHLFVEDLIDMYPDAKVVLNVRRDGAQGWARSMATAIVPFMSLTYRVATFWSLPDYLHYQTEQSWNAVVCRNLSVRSFWDIRTYSAHNEHVKELCLLRGRNVLVWDPSQGWSELCSFLSVKEPIVPIPHNNEKGQMERVFRWRLYIGLQQWVIKVAIPALAVGMCGFLAMILMRRR
jgi:hypothetical protein